MKFSEMHVPNTRDKNPPLGFSRKRDIDGFVSSTSGSRIFPQNPARLFGQYDTKSGFSSQTSTFQILQL
jgi:hypothetical protein